jgi:tetratricopeptide (TPR) repeat protein
MNNLMKAIKLREAELLEEAKTILFDLAREEPRNPSVWYQLAWVHDVLTLEKGAVSYYIIALELGLAGEERQGALLGLGSTYRSLGMYDNAVSVFEEAIKEYPERREFRVFYAMTLFNLKDYGQAMEILLKQLADTSEDKGIQAYKKAIHFYADKLDQIWK